MLLSILYLLVNVLCLLAVAWRKYWRLWPAWCLMQALVCWQAYVRIAIPKDDRAVWMTRWAPGEYWLLAIAGIAVMESLWRSLEDWHWRNAICAGTAGFISWVAFRLVYEPSGDWYEVFLARRVALNLDMAILAFIAALSALCWAHRWPRVDRMHACLLAVLMIGHVVISDWSIWGQSALKYRWLEMTVCGGWLLNLHFLAQDYAAIRRADQIVRQSHGATVDLATALALRNAEILLPTVRTALRVR